jgi:hypothetical protein
MKDEGSGKRGIIRLLSPCRLAEGAIKVNNVIVIIQGLFRSCDGGAWQCLADGSARIEELYFKRNAAQNIGYAFIFNLPI